MKSKLLVSENLVHQKQKEIETLKLKIEKKIAEDEKYLIRDRQTFERQFGRMPRQGEEKVNTFKCFNRMCV